MRERFDHERGLWRQTPYRRDLWLLWRHICHRPLCSLHLLYLGGLQPRVLGVHASGVRLVLHIPQTVKHATKIIGQCTALQHQLCDKKTRRKGVSTFLLVVCMMEQELRE